MTKTPALARHALLASLVAAAGQAHAQSVGDPAGSSPLIAALDWVQGTLLGNLATTAAVIAVAAVGFLMLTGRMDWRRGLTVVIGCFIIFGAVSIVAGIRSLAGGLH
ncbi:TrbC/VirB2 family protein [Phenylobacterium sp.]|jgi:type IV secretion system protein VirB2|uniref:TrbC/VirB2 family protein n=1 Tax=Phenylobacterium sp. TaxID=1871053 RepID=UPI002F3FC49C